MRSRRCQFVQLVSATAIIILMFAASGCVTSGGNDSSEAASESGVDPMSGEENVPSAKSSTLTAGPIEDIDLRELVYQGMEKQLTATENEKTRVEIGDFESFKFSIVKMQKGNEDVTNIPSEQPDRLVIEATGWYKRSAKDNDEPQENCFSFDSTVHVNAEGENWAYDDKDSLSFNRENSEDCF